MIPIMSGRGRKGGSDHARSLSPLPRKRDVSAGPEGFAGRRRQEESEGEEQLESHMSTKVEGNTALVTGGTNGIGLASAQALAAEEDKTRSTAFQAVICI